MTTNNTINAEMTALVESAMAFVTASAILDEAKKTAELARETMVPILRAHVKDDWKDLSKAIKTALSSIQGMNSAQVTAWLGVFKTCFEYKILPTQANADRLRKAEVWTNWNGSKVPNTYGKVHAPKVEPVKAEAPKVEPVKPAPTVKGGPSVAKPVITEDAMTPFDVWATYFDRFIEHGVTTHYIQTLAGLLGTDSKELALAMVTAKRDLVAKAESATKK